MVDPSAPEKPLPEAWNYWMYDSYREEVDRDTREIDDPAFHSHSERADFDEWSRKSFWTADEATALSFGKSPEQVNLTTVGYVSSGQSLFAQSKGDLNEPMHPAHYIAWCEREGISFPDDLAEKVSEYERGMAELVAELREKVTSLQDRVDDLTREKREQLYKIDTLRSSPPREERPKSAAAKAKERISLLKLVLGMAIGGYGYNPSALRNKATQDIVGDFRSTQSHA